MRLLILVLFFVAALSASVVAVFSYAGFFAGIGFLAIGISGFGHLIDSGRLSYFVGVGNLTPSNVSGSDPSDDDACRFDDDDDVFGSRSFNIDGTPAIGSMDIDGNPVW